MAGYGINACNICWDNSNINTTEWRLLNYLTGTELRILNLNNEPTFFNAGRREILDNWVTSPGVATFEREWRVTNDISVSPCKRIDFNIHQITCSRPISKTSEGRLDEVLNRTPELQPLGGSSYPLLKQVRWSQLVWEKPSKRDVYPIRQRKVEHLGETTIC